MKCGAAESPEQSARVGAHRNLGAQNRLPLRRHLRRGRPDVQRAAIADHRTDAGLRADATVQGAVRAVKVNGVRSGGQQYLDESLRHQNRSRTRSDERDPLSRHSRVTEGSTSRRTQGCLTLSRTTTMYSQHPGRRADRQQRHNARHAFRNARIDERPTRAAGRARLEAGTGSCCRNFAGRGQFA